MLTISKPLSAGQAQSYHAEEFGNARENYYTEGEQIRGEWHGRLAEEWGLRGEVREEHFQWLSEGQHPISGEQLIRHQAAREYTNRHGEKVSAMEHRAGWDATFSAPKSVSLTALVGGDERVREAHRESVSVALDELERYVQARIGGNLPAETTGKWIAAKFEHDSARPVDGYAAPQLHTHAAKTRRSGNRIEHIAAAPDAERRAARRAETALRSRRIEPCEHKTDERVLASAKGKRPRAAGR
jgi:conjugative relaxase-like TrwC/TraI family protein